MCMCTRIRAYVWQIAIGTQDHDQHTTGTHDHWKREDSGKAGKSEYICIIAGNKKKYKKVKKNLEI